MTIRERVSLALVVTGVCVLGWGTYELGGWAVTAVVVGGLAAVLGVLLGLDDSEPNTDPGPPPVPWDDDEMIEDGVQRG